MFCADTLSVLNILIRYYSIVKMFIKMHTLGCLHAPRSFFVLRFHYFIFYYLESLI